MNLQQGGQQEESEQRPIAELEKGAEVTEKKFVAKCTRCGQLLKYLPRAETRYVNCPKCKVRLALPPRKQDQTESNGPVEARLIAPPVAPPPIPTSDRYGPKPSGGTMPSEFRCPKCGTNVPPQIVKSLSTTGWLVLLLGLLFCFVGALFAMFFMEEKSKCPLCGFVGQRFRSHI